MQKLICNMITTGAFTRLGYVYGNLMVNVDLKNGKLAERGIAIVQKLTGCDHQSAVDALDISDGSLPTALVLLEAGITPVAARRRLKTAKGNVRSAIAAAEKQKALAAQRKAR